MPLQKRECTLNYNNRIDSINSRTFVWFTWRQTQISNNSGIDCESTKTGQVADIISYKISSLCLLYCAEARNEWGTHLRLDSATLEKNLSGGEPLEMLCTIWPIRGFEPTIFHDNSDGFDHYTNRPVWQQIYFLRPTSIVAWQLEVILQYLHALQTKKAF